MSGRGRNEVISRPTDGTSQISRDGHEDDVHRRARDELDDPPGERGRLRPDELGGLGRHPWIASLRKRLMLKTMIGMIRSSITTAIAEP